MSDVRQHFASPDAIGQALGEAGYLSDESLATAIYLAVELGKPLLLEGVPGVGKTEAAKALGLALGRGLIRLQCYEGIDSTHALYEWNYARQLLALRQSESGANLYADEYLIERPLLKALRAAADTVLLIDEVDRSDHEFEAFLLEFLSDFQITIPERGTIKAATPPVTVLTSNRTRDLHEALRRRCIYHWIGYPDANLEARIIMLKARNVAEETARAVVAAVNGLRRLPLAKAPGISEAIEWADAAALLDGGRGRWPDAFRRSIGAVLKDEDDLELARDKLPGILESAGM